ncbi:UDP-glycosyltransferase 74F2-like [Punica granatum]|uniref:Glycosyltransferase n=1 Tax=Punica granatum TaxID=22663 RepID=A0A6P8E0M4_PUNGR|nr:UDP-glycosyltransferase 74F2-like [Punica granatum]
MEGSETHDQAHVLVVPYPVQGHINPMLQFSKRLVSKGVRATLAVTVYLSKSMHMEPTGPIEIDTISDGYDEGGSAAAESFEAQQMNLQVVGSRTLHSLIQRLDESGKPVHAVIYDGFLPWALDVAKECGKLGVVFFTQTCAVNNIYYHVKKGLVELPLKGPRVSFPGLPPLDPSETPSFIYILGSYPAIYNMVVDQFVNVEDADYVLFNTFYELEKEVADWMNSNLWPLKTIGPTVPSMYLDRRLEDDRDYTLNLFKPNNDACASWLGRKPPRSVIYVSFGSMAELPAQQMAELAAALSHNRHRYNFLWIIRESEMPKLPLEFIKSTSEDECGLILPWCSQLEVLRHDSIGGFLTHCGLNSVLEAICVGVPLVAVPQWTDQPTNAKYVEDVWGTGLRARPNKDGLVGREELGLCIEEVMEGEKGKVIRENVKKWKNLAIEAMDEGGSSDRNIDEFVAKLSSSCK